MCVCVQIKRMIHSWSILFASIFNDHARCDSGKRVPCVAQYLDLAFRKRTSHYFILRQLLLLHPMRSSSWRSFAKRKLSREVSLSTVSTLVSCVCFAYPYSLPGKETKPFYATATIWKDCLSTNLLATGRVLRVCEFASVLLVKFNFLSPFFHFST